MTTARLSRLRRRAADLQAENQRLRKLLRGRHGRPGRHSVEDDEETLRLTFESATDYAILTFDRSGRVETWNTGACRIFGYDADEIVGRSVVDLFTPEDRNAKALQSEIITAVEAGRSEFGRWYIGKNGLRFWGRGEVMPIQDRRGAVHRFVKILRDRTEERRVEDVLRLAEKRYRALVQATALIVWHADPTGAVTDAVPAWQEMTGQTPEEYRGWGWMEVVYPGDLPTVLERWTNARENRVSAPIEFRVRSRLGIWRHMLAITVPVLDSEGQAREWVGTLTDVTEIREAAAHQRHLMDELAHRVKNTLAEVQAIAAHTLRAAESPAAFQADFGARLKALAKAHDLLLQGNWKAARLRDVILAEIEPYAGEATARFVLRGRQILLAPRAALALAMAFHELASNAAKYGALSSADGKIDISWDSMEHAGAHWLRINWTEAGGPEVQLPQRRGFGSVMIKRGVGHALGGTVDLVFAPDGVRCTMEIPIAIDRELGVPNEIVGQ